MALSQLFARQLPALHPWLRVLAGLAAHAPGITLLPAGAQAFTSAADSSSESSSAAAAAAALTR